MNNLASININFDSIRWGFGIKNRNFTDLAFLHIADWFFEFSKSYYSLPTKEEFREFIRSGFRFV